MNLCVLLPAPLADATIARVTIAFPNATVSAVGDAAGLDQALTEDLQDVVVLAASLAGAMTPSTGELVRDSQVILVVNEEELVAESGLDAIPALEPSDFLVYVAGEAPDVFAREAAMRIESAFYRAQLSTHERQQQEAITRSLREIVYRLDESGNFVYVNDAVSQIGHDPENLVGRHFSDVLDPDQVAKVSRDAVLPGYEGKTTGDEAAPKLFDERRRGNRKTSELEVILCGGGRLAESHFIGLVTASGDIVTEIDGTTTVIGTVGVIRDVSAETSGSNSLAKLYTVADTAPYGILVTDPDLVVEYANPAFYRTLGLVPLDVISHRMDETVGTGLDPQLASEIKACMETEAILDRTVELMLASRTSSEFRVTARPVYGANGKCSGAVIALTTSDLRPVPQPESASSPDEIGPRDLGRAIVAAFTDADDRVQVHAAGTVQSAELIQHVVRVVRIAYRFGREIVGGGTAVIAVHGSGGRARMDVECTVDPDGQQSSTDPDEIERISDLSEAARNEVIQGGGVWRVTRGDGAVRFSIEIAGETDALADSGAAGSGQAKPIYKDSGFEYWRFARAYADSPAVLEEITAIYLEEVPHRITTIEQSLDPVDFGVLIKAAHSLANTSGTLQAHGAVGASRELEAAARESDEQRTLDAATRLLPLVREMLERIRNKG